MKATRISSEKAVLVSISNGERFKVCVIKEIYKIPEAQAHLFPEGFKVSMIAFRDDNPERKILLDCHPPKGPHYHRGDVEVSFQWQGLRHADALFWKLVEDEFGQLQEDLE